MKIISTRSFKPGLGQGEGDDVVKKHKKGDDVVKKHKKGDDVVKQQDGDTLFALHTGSDVVDFFLCPVSDNATAEELEKQKLRRHSPPNSKIEQFGSSHFGFGTSYVSVGSMVYCIGGQKSDRRSSNEVRKFDTKDSSLQVDQSPPAMNVARCFPVVVAIDKIIYVFDGLRETVTEDSVWAECLDTNMPVAMQKWKPLKKPPFCLYLEYPSFAIPFETGSILISNRRVSLGALLYNIRDEIWMTYKFSFQYTGVVAPVGIACEKTMYWIYQNSMFAYDHDKHVLYTGVLYPLLHDFKRSFDAPRKGPYLVHLKDDIFCCFTLYVHRRGLPETGVVQCTKFQVTKNTSESRGCLHLNVLGYKSYKCGKMFNLFGVVPIQERICLSERMKRRSSAENREWVKEKEMMHTPASVPQLRTII